MSTDYVKLLIRLKIKKPYLKLETQKNFIIPKKSEATDRCKQKLKTPEDKAKGLSVRTSEQRYCCNIF